MSSTGEDLARTSSAQWLCEARAQHAEWANHVRCFAAFGGLLSSYCSSCADGCWKQSPVNPPGLLKAVARGANFASGSVFNRWTAKQSGYGIRRWAGPDPSVKPREAFVAEAKIVSFWPYRQGAVDVADAFEMSLAEVIASYLRALGAWAGRHPALAACAPAGAPQCVVEDMHVLARRRFVGQPSDSGVIEATAAELESLAGALVAAVLDDASLTPLGAFNVVRSAALRLLTEPPEPVAVKASNALSELADRLLHCGEGDGVLTVAQARQLHAEMTSLSALLGAVAGQ